MPDPEFETNPFASPLAHDEYRPRADWGDEEMIRHEHLKHEASIRSIGILYYIPAFLFGIGGAFAIVGVIGSLVLPEPQAIPIATMMGVMGVYLLLSVLFAWCGRGLRDLDQRVRLPVLILSAIGLITIGIISFPVGTIINGYILYLVGCKKGKFILSPEYQQIRKATPHIKYRSSFAVLLLIGLLIVVAIIMAVLMLGG